MPEIKAFKGTFYNPQKIDDLAAVTAPPYDVITAAEKQELLNRSPYNVIRLILGKAAAEMGGKRPESEFIEAAAIFRRWLDEGILVTDPEPAIYDLEEEFTAVGKHYCRRGFIARLRLENDGQVRPHEKTMSAPKEDRLELTRHCQANFSQFFTLYDDPGSKLEKSLEKARPDQPLFSYSADGITRRLWRITDPQTLAQARQQMAGQEIFIADGHHRYETALLYQREQLKANPDATGNEPWNFVMSYFSSMSSPGLAILPTHRLLSNFPLPEAAELQKRLQSYFHIEECQVDIRQPEAAAQLLRELEKNSDQPGFIVVSANLPRPLHLTLQPESAAEILGQLPSSLAELDVSVLQQLVFSHILEISSADMEQQRYTRYTQDAGEALTAVANGQADLAVLLNATRIGQVSEVARQGEKMPQKSTFFYPKLATGLIISRLDLPPI
jgi:uncharacterized protein (DUF1015 family)